MTKSRARHTVPVLALAPSATGPAPRARTVGPQSGRVGQPLRGAFQSQLPQRAGSSGQAYPKNVMSTMPSISSVHPGGVCAGWGGGGGGDSSKSCSRQVMQQRRPWPEPCPWDHAEGPGRTRAPGVDGWADGEGSRRTPGFLLIGRWLLASQCGVQPHILIKISASPTF